MAQGNKITFSNAELDAMGRPDFFYIKHSAMKNMKELFGETEREIRNIIHGVPDLSLHTDIHSPKIFRGENYRQLPYMVLDFPRKFNTETVFAFRSMFWWGKEFSFTLHLQGSALEFYRKRISGHLNSLKGKEFYYCVNKSPWQYYFESDNYVMLDELLAKDDFPDEQRSRDFIKLSRKTDISNIKAVPGFASETLALLLQGLNES